VCETGGGRRTWLRGMENVIKMHTLKCAAFNLGLLLREVFGLAKPRNWEAGRLAALAALICLLSAGMTARQPLRMASGLIGMVFLVLTLTAVLFPTRFLTQPKIPKITPF